MPSLYKFQEEALSDLLAGKRLCLLQTGAGKTAVMFKWLAKQSPKKVLVVTTPSKRDSGDMEAEANLWNGESWRKNLESFEVTSWHGLHKWVKCHWDNLDEYAYAFDEIAKAKAGVSSGMGKAFLRITGQTGCWTGYTATPGDNWLCFYPYFQAAHLVRNKTAFKARYVTETFFKGYPDIIGYRHEDELLHMWKKISTSPDTSALNRELPPETHKVVEFKKPTGYDKAIKTRMTPDGEWLDTTMGLAHYLRELCFTKAKQQWLTDFLEGLGTQAVIFYSYIEEGDKIEELAKKALPKGAKVWRIDGAHHEIPTADTIGKYDVVVCQWQSGSEALNLQFMHYWVSTTPNYSYSTSLQARGRIKRIGQTEPMFFYYLRCNNTIEDDIYKTLGEKRDFAAETWVDSQITRFSKKGIDK